MLSINVGRSGRTSKQVAEPYKKNLFLQSLYDEELEGSSSPVDDIGNDDKRRVLDKDIVHCLESDVHFWTDFSKVYYHPRSLCELNSSWSDIHDFDNYGIAQQVTSSQGEDMIDRLRFFTEECDHIQVVFFPTVTFELFSFSYFIFFIGSFLKKKTMVVCLKIFISPLHAGLSVYC